MGGGGFDIETVPTWLRLMAEKAGQPGFERWRQMVASTGGCSHPIRLVGQSTTADAKTGEVIDTYSTVDEPVGHLLTACGNRRASRCESCARAYADDTFHLIRSGLAGGRDVPPSVAGHPRVFATFTAPSFGPVHTRVGTAAGSVRPCHPRDKGPKCMRRHDEGDPVLGQAVDPASYDYRGAVLWNNRAGELWHVFAVYLRRRLAEVLGVPRSPACRHRGEMSGALRWGRQLDLRPIRATDAGGDWTDERVARYIAKYATKGAEASGTVNRPLRNVRHLDRIQGLTTHARRMIETCWELGGVGALELLNLREWTHMLGYGGHFSTKSRRYSTTLGVMRADRARFRRDEARSFAGLDPLPEEHEIVRAGSWQVAGAGYRNASEETWAEIIRESNRHRPIRRPEPIEPDEGAA
jgi:hypothetical protein